MQVHSNIGVKKVEEKHFPPNGHCPFIKIISADTADHHHNRDDGDDDWTFK